MFIVKKIVSRLLFPLPLGLGLALLGLIVLWSGRRQRLGKGLVTVGLALLLVLSTAPASGWLLASLEGAYPPFGTGRAAPVALDEIAYVIVLAGGIEVVPAMPLTRQVGGGGMARLMEGYRVYTMCPNSKLVLSGGYGAEPDSPREILTNYLFMRSLGVPAEDMIVENTSWDTETEARHVAPIVGRAPSVLVTSAYHMRRALPMFEKQGLRPIPAPADFHTGLKRVSSPESFYPSASSLWASEVAIYEYIGMLWARLRGLV
ncbi:MAG: ElyC/SanA/YdcF family protein [Chloroflexota bacterium]